jgi:hypothetical protein
MRSRAVRLVARLLIVALYVNGLGPILTGPDPLAAVAAASPAFDGGGGSGGTGSNVSLFGPKKYTRTGGLFNLYTDNITVPDWIRSPYVVRIKNGESDGSHRVTGATIFLSGLPVATPLDFNQYTDTVERPVLLLPILVQLLGLSVKLIGPIGSYVTITVLGRSGDTVAPSLTITDPPANTTTNDNTPHLALTYADSDTTDCHASGIDTSTLKVTLDGIDRTSLFTVTSTGAQATIPDNLALSDGTHVLHAEIRDRGGNLATADRTFSVHTVTEPPTLTVTAPAENALVSSPTLSVSGTVAGHGTGAVAVQCRGENSVTGQVSGTTWTCAGVGLHEGDNAIVVTATDSGGSSSVTRHVALDTAAPTLVIVQPVEGQSINSDTVTVSGTVSDAHAVTVRVNTVDATITGTSFTATVPVGSGPTATITVTATDPAGNSTQKSVTLQVDRVAPAIQITSPTEGAFVRGSVIQVTGTVTDASYPLQVDVNGQSATVNGNSFTAAITAADGPLTLTATARDSASNTGTSHVSVTVDSVAPAISITAPADGAMTRADSIHFTGTLTDASPTTLRIDGTSVPVADGAFATDVPVTADGPRTITLVATDAAGNAQSLDWHVIVDRTQPTIDITTPAVDAVLGQSPVSVDGQYQDQTTTTITVNGIEATRTQGAWHADVPLAEGRQTLTVVAVDAAGNQKTITRDVFLDFTAPTIAITSPADGSYTVATAVTVSGTVNDTHLSTVTVNGVTATVTGGQFEAANVPVGGAANNTIDATAVDAAGHQNHAQITLHVPQTQFTLNITTPADGVAVRGPNIEVRGTVSSEAGVLSVFVNGKEAALAGNGTWSVTDVPVMEGPQTLHAIATDTAGRTQTADSTVRVDTVVPTLTITEPAVGLVTKEATVHVAGTVEDTNTVTVMVNDQNAPVVNGQFAKDVSIGAADGAQMVTVVATDSVGNATTKTVQVIVDRTAPTLAVVAPENGALVSGLPIVVQGTIHDDNGVSITVDGNAVERTDDTWRMSFATLAEGPHTFTVVATDAAGNAAPTQSVTVTIDVNAPVLTITLPASGTITNLATVDVTGTVQDASLTSLVVTPAGTQPVTVTNGQFTAPGIPLTEGDTTILVTATDRANRSTPMSIVVTRDSTAPELELTAPDRITRRQTIQLAATANEPNLTVVLGINGAETTFTAPPYSIPLTIPDGLAMGDTFTVSAKATDRAGNVTTASHVVRVIADSALVGQVLSDATSRPIENATVHIGTEERTTDLQGRYTLPTEQASIALSVDAEGMTSVWRVVSMSTGTGTLPIDARLTPLAKKVDIGPDGGQLAALSIVGSGPATAAASTDGSTSPGPLAPTASDPVMTISLPAGAVTTGTAAVRLTPLSAQGLPDLLPLGWSPIAAFDLRSDATLYGLLNVRATFASTQAAALGSTLTLVEYRPLLHAWIVSKRELTPDASGIIDTTVPGVGAFALVVPDAQDQPVVAPDIESPLSGVPAVEIPTTAASQGIVEPAVIPPTGGTARGQLRIDSPQALPSGTLVQAEITETFTLPSNQVASEEQRHADIVLYRVPGRAIDAGNGTAPPPDTAPPVSATLPIKPAQTFDATSLLEGHVHLDILAGRESVRGTTGGLEPLTVTSGDARLVIPANTLHRDTAVSLEHVGLSLFLPPHAALTPLSELVVDVPGPALESPAELSIAASAVTQTPGASFVIARVDRVDGVPFLTVVASAEVSGDRLIARAVPGLPGVTATGRYVFYRVQGTVGYVTGITRAGGQPFACVLSSDSLPFIARSDASSGRYTLAALVGAAPVTVTARVPRSSLEKHDSVIVTAGTAASLDLALAATVTTATVTPADGARGVSRQPQITVTTSTPLTRDTVTTETVHLFKVTGSDSTPVLVRPLLAGSGQTLSIVPNARLEADTVYRLEVTGQTDIYGGAVAVPVTTFRTEVEAAPSYKTEDLTFSFPDTAGLVTIAAKEHSFPVGSQFLIINSGAGDVLSLTTLNDGSVSGKIRATLNDRLVVTITDPDGRVTTFTRSEFVDEATGRTAIGPGGGTVNGPGGIQLRVPDGAVSEAITLKITPVGEDAFPKQPDVPGGHFGAGMKIEASAAVRFAKEVDVVFPVPDAAKTTAESAGMQAKDAFYYVFGRSTASDGEPLFETVDYANVEGDKVVTASFPFAGWIDVGGMAAGYAFVMWSFNQLLPGQPTSGVITGQVLRPVENGATDPTYIGVPGARVELVDPSDQRFDPHTGAITGKDGRYTIFDHRFVSEPVHLQTTVDGDTARATVFAVQRTDTKALADPGIAVLVEKGVFNQIATANLTLPPAKPAAPAPALTIRTMKTTDDGHRADTRGLAVAGTPLIIGIDAGDAQVRGVSIAPVGAPETAEVSYAVQEDPAVHQSPRDPLAMPFITSEPFTPPQAGSYRIKATALTTSGTAISAEVTIRVLADGGHVETDPNLPPAVITALSNPKPDATGVPVTIFASIAFTEPVRHVADNVHLRDADGNDVSIRISGVTVDAAGNVVPVDDMTNASVVTGITIQPRYGLSYGTTYHLVLAPGIDDLDPTPKPLVPYDASFTTFGPAAIGGTEEQFASPGLIVLGDRAYVLETKYGGGVGGIQSGALHVFNVTDPTLPQEIGTPTSIEAAPRDIGGEGHTVAIATMPHMQFVNSDIASGPSNLLIYDVSGQTPQFVGAASLTDNINDGTPNRVVIKDQMAYIATMRKGLQVVDLSQTALGDLDGAPGYEVYRRLYAPGEGVNRQAVVLTMPITDPARPNDTATVMLNDLKVGDYRIDDVPQRLVLATGTPAALGLAIVNPLTQAKVWQGALLNAKGSLAAGQAIALAHIGDRDLAIVGGYGTYENAGASGVIAIVDLTPLLTNGTPTVLAIIAVPHVVADIVIAGTTAVVSAPSTGGATDAGTATLVGLGNPDNPTIAGTLTGIGSRMVLSDANVLFSTSRTLLSGQVGPLSGVRTTALQTIVPMVTFEPSYVLVTRNGQTAEDVKVRYRIVPPSSEIGTATLDVRDDQGRVLFNGNVQINGEGVGEITLPKGQTATPTPNFISFEVHNGDGRTSAPFTGGMSPLIPPPTLTELSPSRIVVGTLAPELTIKGRNFGGSATVLFGTDAAEPVIAEARLVSSSEVRVTVPASLLDSVQTLSVQLRAGGQVSNVLTLRIMAPGTVLTTATLDSLEPNQVAAGSDNLWLTLRGTHFQPGDSMVFVDAGGNSLTTEYVSDTEMRALVPAALLADAGPLGFRIESFQDSTIATETRVLDVVGAAIIVPPIGVTAVEPIDVPYASSGVPAETIHVKGQGFDTSTRVLARVDGGDPVPVTTVVNGASDLSVRLSPETWGEHYLTATFTVETPYGTRQATATAANTTPGVFLTENADQHTKPLGRVLPARFYDPNGIGYFLDADAKLLKNTFDNEAHAIKVHVRTPQDIDEKDLRVALISEKADGTQLDSIPSFNMKKGPKRGMKIKKLQPETFESELPIGAVLDSIDDGHDSAKDEKTQGSFTFSEHDGDSNDQTIQVQSGGRVRVQFSMAKSGALPMDSSVAVDVCPASERLKIPLQVYKVAGIPASDQELLEKIDGARKIWSELCVDLELVGGSIQTIADLGNKHYSLLEDVEDTHYSYDAATKAWVNCALANAQGFSGTVPAVCVIPQGVTPAAARTNRLKQAAWQVRYSLSPDMRTLIDQIPLNGGTKAMRIVFIDQFVSASRIKSTTQFGVAITPTGYKDQLLLDDATNQPLAPARTGVTFIATAKINGEEFNYRTVAHEIAHAVVGTLTGNPNDPSHAYLQVNGQWVSDEANILRSGWVDEKSVRRKRFNAAQEKLLHGSKLVVHLDGSPQ